MSLLVKAKHEWSKLIMVIISLKYILLSILIYYLFAFNMLLKKVDKSPHKDRKSKCVCVRV